MPSTLPAPTSTTVQLKRPSYPFSGKLIVLESGKTTNYDPFAGLSSLVAINFPMMPDAVELARSVDYLVVNSQVMPDGIHQYKSTQPLSIPISFRLNAMDKEYCPKGSLNLLQLAALLHSFALPITNTSGATVHVTTGQSQPQAVPKTETASLENRAQSTDNPYNITPDTGFDFYPPVTLRLELMYTDENNPGIVCTGYVKDVKAKLNGPFLRGQGKAYNLPSTGDYEFTFVHVPGYGNNFSIATNTNGQDASLGQAYADDVRSKLYNTTDITRISDRSFKGFNS